MVDFFLLPSAISILRAIFEQYCHKYLHNHHSAPTLLFFGVGTGDSIHAKVPASYTAQGLRETPKSSPARTSTAVISPNFSCLPLAKFQLPTPISQWQRQQYIPMAAKYPSGSDITYLVLCHDGIDITKLPRYSHVAMWQRHTPVAANYSYGIVVAGSCIPLWPRDTNHYGS